MPCCLHDGSNSYTVATVDSFPSAFSGVSVVSSGSHVTDVSRSHTPPERDMNSNRLSNMSKVDVGSTDDVISSQGVSPVLCCIHLCFANNDTSMNSTRIFVV